MSIITPDSGHPHPFRRKVAAAKPIPHTRSRQEVTLECGHKVIAFGNLVDHAPDGVICEKCAQEAAVKG